ncbi:hypothetical protein FQR65_LT19984 [Abscondita terminalis]|nr:hypothetical protein FQR65_LT19984 [Abscondita terminalis]
MAGPEAATYVQGRTGFELRAEYLMALTQGLHGAWRVGTEWVLRGQRRPTRPNRVRLSARLALAVLQRPRSLHAPGRPCAARVQETAGFTGEAASMLRSTTPLCCRLPRWRPYPSETRATFADPPAYICAIPASRAVMPQWQSPTSPRFFTFAGKPISLVPDLRCPTGEAVVPGQPLPMIPDVAQYPGQVFDCCDAGRLAPDGRRRRGSAAWSALPRRPSRVGSRGFLRPQMLASRAGMHEEAQIKPLPNVLPNKPAALASATARLSQSPVDESCSDRAFRWNNGRVGRCSRRNYAIRPCRVGRPWRIALQRSTMCLDAHPSPSSQTSVNPPQRGSQHYLDWITWYNGIYGLSKGCACSSLVHGNCVDKGIVGKRYIVTRTTNEHEKILSPDKLDCVLQEIHGVKDKVQQLSEAQLLRD